MGTLSPIEKLVIP